MKIITIAWFLFLLPITALADVIDDIRARNKLIVGVKTDYKPYGFIAPDGTVVGIEPDLARQVAEKLKVDIEFVSVASSNRMNFLSEGKIDLMIATMTDKAERRKIVLASDPNYYSSGTNVIAQKSYDFNQWSELANKKVCGVAGAFYNKSIESKFSASVIEFKNTGQGLAALKLGKCVAFVFDDSFIAGLLSEQMWADSYEMPFETIDDAPWALAVRNGEKRFHTVMNEMIIDWHKTGEILKLEAKYGIRSTAYAINMHRKYNEILKVHTKER